MLLLALLHKPFFVLWGLCEAGTVVKGGTFLYYKCSITRNLQHQRRSSHIIKRFQTSTATILTSMDHFNLHLPITSNKLLFPS